MDTSQLYDFYGDLSDEIHGGPWSGPFLKVSSSLNASQLLFIKTLADAVTFKIDISSS